MKGFLGKTALSCCRRCRPNSRDKCRDCRCHTGVRRGVRDCLSVVAHQRRMDRPADCQCMGPEQPDQQRQGRVGSRLPGLQRPGGQRPGGPGVVRQHPAERDRHGPRGRLRQQRPEHSGCRHVRRHLAGPCKPVGIGLVRSSKASTGSCDLSTSRGRGALRSRGRSIPSSTRW